MQGGREVPFKTRSIRQFAAEIAHDEFDHVRFLHAALGSAAVARPAINIKQSFTAVAIAAGLIKPKAYVVPRNPPANADLTLTLQDWVKDRLAPYKYPRTIEFVAELPKTATGKIQRYRLRS